MFACIEKLYMYQYNNIVSAVNTCNCWVPLIFFDHVRGEVLVEEVYAKIIALILKLISGLPTPIISKIKLFMSAMFKTYDSDFISFINPCNVEL